jgi:hypothetical protein
MTIKVSTWPSGSVIRGRSTAMMSPKKPTHAEFVLSYTHGCNNFIFLCKVYEKHGTSGNIIVRCIYVYAECPLRTFHRSRYLKDGGGRLHRNFAKVSKIMIEIPDTYSSVI